MFERFSSGYYLGELFVEPHDGDRATIHREDHERANEFLYASGEGVERLDAPLVMKLDNAHFPVMGDEDVPTGTLALPREFARDVQTGRREVLIASGDRAWQLLRYAGWEAASGA